MVEDRTYPRIKCLLSDVFQGAANVKGHPRCTYADEADQIGISRTSGGKTQPGRLRSHQLIRCWTETFPRRVSFLRRGWSSLLGWGYSWGLS